MLPIQTDLKRAIITGPTGAVGVSLINELLDNDIEVVAVCRRGSKRIDSIPQSGGVTIVECDLADLKDLPEVLDGKFDAFYHFAWEGTFGASRQDLGIQVSNVRHTLTAVSVAKSLGCSVFVGAGSQCEYGPVNGVLSPDLVCNPDTGYGAAKLAAFHMSRIACTQAGIRHVWCRILSLYGPFDGSHTMVSQIMAQVCDGSTVRCTKGEQVWDYIYSKDVARAFRLVAQRGPDQAIYCLGSGSPRLLREYISAIRDAIDATVEINFGEIDYYPNQVMHLEADISNLTNDTGFNPEYSFERGIEETINWYKQNVRVGN